jgi:CheY-like chemotaxis protein
MEVAKTILVVDDEPDIVYMIRVILRSAGFDVVSAESVASGLEFLSKGDPDLILLDLRLADGEGWQVLDALRADGRVERIPVIILSAHAVPSAADRAITEGAKGYITKPFVAGNLVSAVREWLTD